MPFYEAYGLRIDSAFELPELPPAIGALAADITFRQQAVPRENLSAPNIGLHYAGIASLLIKNGAEVLVDIEPGVDPRIVRLILLGPVLALLLHERGYLVLHASAVELGDIAVAFLGEKGAGKSTTAAAFNSEKYPLLADDVVAVAPETHLVYPGIPQLKLWRQAAEQMTPQGQLLYPLHPDMDKVGLRITETFARSPKPLRRVYALSDGQEFQIQSLRPQEAFMELVKHSYTLSLLESTGTSESHFRQAVALAAQAQVRRLIRPRSLAALSQLVAAVVADAA